MLTDQELLNLSAAPEDSNVFFGEDTTTPASPRPPAPGIVLTVEGAPEVVVDPGGGGGGGGRRHRSQTRSSSRRTARHTSQHRSPSGSRMASNSKQQNGAQQRLLLSSSGPGVSRSQSMRTARRPQSSDPSHRFRQRIASIPNDMTGGSASSNQSLLLPGQEDGDEDVLRLRNFAVTSKGVVNRGDSFRSKSRSSHSVASVPPTPTHQQRPEEEDCGKAKTSEDDNAQETVAMEEDGEGATAAPSQEESPKIARYRVLVLGPSDVGKTALINQFMTSEYMCAYDNSQDEENEKSVPVILNGIESELFFSEHQFAGDASVNFCESYGADAYLVVYSVTSKRSLQTAKECLRLIHKWDDVQSKAVILIGNKTDLARHRVLSPDDGRCVAREESSKFIETSAGINHQVDELLVGILSQIRLKQSSRERALQKRESVSLGGASSSGSRCSCKAKGFLKKILKKACSRSKSCENLHVL